MTDESGHTSPARARAALESVERMTAAGLRRGRAPCWVHAAFALFLGGFVAAQGMTTMPWAVTPLVLAALWFMVMYGGPNAVLARPKQDTSTLAQVVTILGFAAVVLASALGGVLFRVKLGWTWAPLALGVLVAASAYVFVEARTRAWAARQRKAADGA